MSSKRLAISVRGLAKSYSIGQNAGRSTTLAEATVSFLRNPLGREQTETFDALRDVTFDLPRGEILGIIGRNGAGKSTLLKVLSRITHPTSGEVDVYGRVGSLLEVGTGFHPELTGRENVYLNGSILGMSKAEIRRQFDEIVEFAGAGRFLDTPVKRYSSGMYTRLAFAVAAHLESEILIVDEVLAVGDAQFQKKCLRKMGDVAQSGRTVLFVSHNMGAIRQLCTSAICLSAGRVVFQGDVLPALSEYAKLGAPVGSGIPDLQNRGLVHVDAIRFSLAGVTVDSVSSGDDVELLFDMRFDPKLKGDMRVGLAIENPHIGFQVINYSDFHDVWFQPKDGTYVAKLRRLPIVPGQYQLHLRIEVAGEEVFWNTHATTFLVEAGDFFGTGKRGEEALCPWLYDVEWSKP